MDGSAQLPPKPDVALLLLQSQSSVYIHLDPRGANVAVPAWFKNQPQLVLQVGMNMAVPIPDLDVGQTALSCTLSFNRRAEFCRIPWEAIYGLVGEDGRGMIWPDSIPPEVSSAAAKAPDGKTKDSKRPKGHLRLAHSEPPGAAPEGSSPPPSPALDELPPDLAVASAPERVETESTGDLLPVSEPKKEDAPASETLDPQAPAAAKKLPSYLRVIK